MPLDISLFTAHHGVLAGLAFGATFIALWFVAKRSEYQTSTIYRAGTVIVSLIAALSVLGTVNWQLSISLLAAAAVTIAVGRRDEHRSLSPAVQLAAQCIIAAIAVTGGWTIHFVTNPVAAGSLSLSWSNLGPWIIPGSLAAIVWLVFLMNAVNWLDGVDGLAGTVSFVAFLTLGAVSLLPSTYDAQTLALAGIGAGATLAFVLWNWPPARVYLGTSGSWFLGLYIGLVAIVGGGKIATTLLVLAWPTIDVMAVILRRVVIGQAPWQKDIKHHLHHRLLALGISPASIALIAGGASLFLGIAAVFLQTQQKLLILICTAVVLIVSSIAMVAQRKK